MKNPFSKFRLAHVPIRLLLIPQLAHTIIGKSRCSTKLCGNYMLLLAPNPIPNFPNIRIFKEVRVNGEGRGYKAPKPAGSDYLARGLGDCPIYYWRV
jgi:hypothetical protein